MDQCGSGVLVVTGDSHQNHIICNPRMIGYNKDRNDTNKIVIFG